MVRQVLWVTTEANPDPRSGGGLRSLRLVQAVAEVAQVDVVNLGEGLEAESYCRVSGAASARGLPPQPLPAQLRLLQSLLTGSPLGPSRLRSPRVRDVVRRAEAAGGLVVFEHVVTLAHRPRRSPFAVLLHNLDSELVLELNAAQRGVRRLLGAWEHRTTARLERGLAHDPRALVVAVSARDGAAIGPGVEVVPNGADLPACVSPVPGRGSVLFIGSMGYPPNEAAVRWWAERVHPMGGLPPLTVVGQRAHEVLVDLADDPSVDVVGEVPDTTPYLEAARAVVMPIHEGSGTRLKLVEAFAHGRPVVSTRKGAEGFPVRDGEHLLLADSASDFAGAVRRVLEDDELAGSLARAARAMAADYAWPALGRRVAELLSAHATRWHLP